MQGAELDDLSASKSLGRVLWKGLFSASISRLEQRDGGKEKIKCARCFSVQLENNNVPALKI